MSSKRERRRTRPASVLSVTTVVTVLSLCGAGCDTPDAQPLPEQPTETTHLAAYYADVETGDLNVALMGLCYETRYYYCPPLDEVWRAKALVNTCTNEIVHMGDCEEFLDCNPAVVDLGQRDCITAEGKHGRQDLYCDKGHEKAGECRACDEELCDGLDNDCDGVVDNIGQRTCATACGEGKLVCVAGQDVCLAPEPGEEVCDGVDNDCNGEIDEGQLNACGHCGPVPEELCDGLDNNCDGLVDENLFESCSTACGTGHQQCDHGSWSLCSAKPELDEVCNGLDDDCDGEVDEGLSCACDLHEVGTLYPCQSAPLLCGQGFRQCQCVDESCTSTTLSECHALCWFVGPDDGTCMDVGIPTGELCNAHDDDCDDAVDEDLERSCYSGPPGTEGQGHCAAGTQQCLFGQWGHDDGDGFQTGLCPGEVLPGAHDYCNGVDEDCDGITDDGAEMVATDIVLIIDWSGSMEQELNAVLGALQAFAQAYSDKALLRWSLVIGPVGSSIADEQLNLVQDLAPFDLFMETMWSLGGYPMNGINEMLVDALWILLGGETESRSWGSVSESEPSLQDFGLTWNPDANKVIIVWTDELPQSQLAPEVTADELEGLLGGVEELSTYVFSPPGLKSAWLPFTEAGGGLWFELSTSTTKMFSALMEILDDAVCV